MHRIIGGEFAIDSRLLSKNENSIELQYSSGRSALYSILMHIKAKNGKILLPSYLCDSITRTVIDAGWMYEFYQVDEFLHCCDVSDAQNRPNVEKVINAKKNLFQSVDGIVSSLSASQRRAIKAIHRAEVGYVMLKNRQFIKAIPYFLTLLTSYDAFKTEVIKVKGGFERKKIN